MNVILFILLALANTAPDGAVIQLAIGDSYVVPYADSDEVVITKAEVVTHQQLPSGVIVLSAQTAGDSELLLFSGGKLRKRLFVQVKAPPDKRLSLALAALQRQFPQLQITTEGNQLIRLSGQVPQAAEPEIAGLLERYPQLASQLEYLPPAPAPMLVLEVRIAEVKRSFTRHLGIRWPGHVNGPRIEDLGNWLHLPLTAQTTLDIMEREGQARLLAAPTLTAVSSGAADFLVGGEFPVPQVLADGMQDVGFRPYGIQLEIAPTLLPDGHVHADLVAALSSIDPATAVNGIPGLLSRRVSSTLTLPLGETLVLSGLLQHEQAKQADRFPGLHRLPILGSLFESQQFRRAETDLVIMVTPRLASLEREVRANLQRHQRVREDFHTSVGCVGLVEPFSSASVGVKDD